MKNKYFGFLILFLSYSAQSQNVLKTEIYAELDFSLKVQSDWEKINILLKDKDWSEMTEEESALISKYDAMVFEDMWDIVGEGCSWYCGANFTVKTSSELKASTKYNYKASNISDSSYKTAWVEGKEGSGIGETITFEFAENHPMIEEIIFVNGYVKSKKSWKANNRVKKMKMFLDDVFYGIIDFQDVYAEQSLKITLKQKTNKWRLKFEILEVYPGEKYDDTAITEIYFDGPSH
ncbi:NADase-type glycan-binding domain-containing protein [Aureivirga sp. CE67]|uniref:NADase-type glycan-binding domain-containing protein n=1 Tax=Aureivirga sp. CE67 TaxID=1788983 RepID=UPI0018CA15F6|nr:hypothetical protein [Aureivirga sp. CE67]